MAYRTAQDISREKLKETIKSMLTLKLPEGNKCSFEVTDLLRQLNRVASDFHQQVTLRYRSALTPMQRAAIMSHPNSQAAEQKVQGLKTKLKDHHRINLCGIGTTMEFCEAFIEVYKDKYPD